MNSVSAMACGLLGFGIVFALVPLILRATPRILGNRGLDFHHTHKAPVSRFGGLALAAAFVCLEIFIALAHPDQRLLIPGRNAVIFGSLAMFGLGFWDDIRPLGARRKFLGQVLIAVCVYACGIGISQFKIPFTGQIIDVQSVGLILTVLWLVGVTNLINLIDGVDGLAAGICFMLMVLLVYVGYQNNTFILLTSGMAGALLGFLRFNFPPARIYLGDGGAYFLGFQIAAFSLVGSQKGSVVAALIAPLFVLALPILDTGLAVLRRGLRGLPVFRPDRRHLHHHLLGSGMSRRRVVVWFYGMTLVFLGLGFAAFWSRGQLVPVLAGVGVMVLLVCAGKFRFSREWLSVGRMVGNSLAMRQEVQYALCLTEWLRHEAGRRPTLDALYQDFEFAARRLGFTYVRLELADGERCWRQPGDERPSHVFRHELQGGACGVLELRAPACDQPGGNAKWSDCATCSVARSVCARDSRLFGILADLLAEGWAKAAGSWRSEGARLRFDEPAAARVAAPREQKRLGPRLGALGAVRNWLRTGLRN